MIDIVMTQLNRLFDGYTNRNRNTPSPPTFPATNTQITYTHIKVYTLTHPEEVGQPN